MEKKDKLYGKNNPVRRIDSISYVHDYTKGENITGSYCGSAVVAMLTGVNFDEIIEMMKGVRCTKQAIKKVLDYYGISYALKSAKFAPDVPLPEISIIRMIIANNASEKSAAVYDFKNGTGHWGLYFKGKYYDPDWGICDECPPQLKIFQVWEIYP